MALSGHWSSRVLWVAILLPVLCLLSCARGTKRVDMTGSGGAETSSTSGSRIVSGVKITAPMRRVKVSSGSEMRVEWSNSYAAKVDSTQVVYDNQLVATVIGADSLCNFVLDAGVGVRNIRVQSFYADGNYSVAIVPVQVMPTTPKKLSYKVVATYPHNKSSFTQGLYYQDGFLFEGTGQYGKSALLKVEPTTGKSVVTNQLKSNYFGEGVAELNGKIYQLTWTNGVCLVYNAKTMQQEQEYNYASQGWGLTTDGDVLIMSDGSNMLTIVNPENFSPIRQIQVYDNNGPVDQLNELEFVDGLVWANVWTTNRVVAIDYKSGAVVAELDLSNLLSANEKSSLDVIDHVLNGIAYDKDSGYYYFTGKCWPKIFKIQIQK